MLPPFAAVDDREAAQVDDVARGNDVGLPEEHDRVAVGMCAGHPVHHHRVVIEIHRPHARRERLARPQRRSGSCRRRCSRVSTFSCDEDRGVRLVGERVGIDLDAGRADHLVAADVIHVGAGIDDQADRLAADRLDRGDDLLGGRRRAAVDEDQAVLADMHRDVGSRRRRSRRRSPGS